MAQSSFWKQKLFPLESFPQAQFPRGPLQGYLVYVPHVLASHGSDDVGVGVGGVVMVEFVAEVVKRLEVVEVVEVRGSVVEEMAVEVRESVGEEMVVDKVEACLFKLRWVGSDTSVELAREDVRSQAHNSGKGHLPWLGRGRSRHVGDIMWHAAVPMVDGPMLSHVDTAQNDWQDGQGHQTQERDLHRIQVHPEVKVKGERVAYLVDGRRNGESMTE